MRGVVDKFEISGIVLRYRRTTEVGQQTDVRVVARDHTVHIVLGQGSVSVKIVREILQESRQIIYVPFARRDLIIRYLDIIVIRELLVHREDIVHEDTAERQTVLCEVKLSADREVIARSAPPRLVEIYDRKRLYVEKIAVQRVLHRSCIMSVIELVGVVPRHYEVVKRLLDNADVLVVCQGYVYVESVLNR